VDRYLFFLGVSPFGSIGRLLVYIPGVAAHEDILSVSAYIHCATVRPAIVDTVDGAEGVDKLLVVGQSAGRAGLESDIVAGSGRVEGVDGGENGVDVEATATVEGDVRDHRRTVPVFLEVAHNLRGDGARLAWWPRVAAKVLPSTRALCWTAVVKKELPLTSSHRSKPVWFQYWPT
jgi:hypothetical protein